MATPELTDEQRAAALVKATAVRSARRVFKEELSRGEMSLEQAITRAKADEALAGIRVRDLLQCLPGIGPKRAESAMEEIGISPARRIRGLGAHQVEALVEREHR
ncbi:integration host factor, actinobacterial type [Demequina activiva]|uniref:Integration host factor (MihF) n=1 Tax=Demequina activiva TaxID=1582364 RepID=A0A919Q6A4_9MICO|nr:integration host factor, actinobacterial type [Demequina activiva]GIG54605.1 putative integration host factor (MihF) [Demequina activiva]